MTKEELAELAKKVNTGAATEEESATFFSNLKDLLKEVNKKIKESKKG